MRGYRWGLAAILLFPNIVLAKPVQEGTQVQASAGAGTYHSPVGAGCAAGPQYTNEVEHAGGSVSIHHKEKSGLRVSGSGQFTTIHVTDAIVLDRCVGRNNTEECQDEIANDPPPGRSENIGERTSLTTAAFGVGYEGSVAGFEVGMLTITRPDSTEVMLDAELWVGVQDAV